MASPDREYLTGLFGLEGKVALVTGGRQGIGRAIALALARAGARVAVTGRDAGSLGELGRELDAIGAEHLEMSLEVGDPAQIEAVVEAAAGKWGRLDVLVNNAGVSIRRAAADYEVGEWDTILSTNLRAAFLLARAAARHMTEGGRIVSLSSTFARSAVAERAPYAASKAGLEQLTRALAVEWAARGITVNCVAPGATLTESRRAVLGDEETAARRIAQIPLGRLGAPEDVAGAVLLLASEAGGFVTGQTLVVDGGYTLGADA
jgi:NAD(P)-dependent dehydrogenase (short-subunit alcohol dehydrogenase family)